MKKYDWIIVGGSFAGLATAKGLSGKGLVIDKNPIGENVTSACGTFKEVPLALHIEESIVQEHHALLLHVNGMEIELKSPYPFCVIDYKIFCTRLAEYGNFDFLEATVLGREDRVLITTKGDFESDILVDASGWRSVLTTYSLPKNSYNTGVEIVVPGKGNGLHFFYEGRKTKRIYWIFPAGQYLRIGSGSYFAKTKIKEALFTFLNHNNLHLHSNNLHGNVFPFSLRKPVVNGIFRVGDSAGQCLALTGEGIRPAIYFGTNLGYLLEKVLKGEITLKYAQKLYKNFVYQKKKAYKTLTNFQRYTTSLPNLIIALVAKVASTKSHFLLEQYRRIFDIQRLVKILEE